jgi:hypothetical protein
MASSFWSCSRSCLPPSHACASAAPAKYAKDDLPDVICLTFERGRERRDFIARGQEIINHVDRGSADRYNLSDLLNPEIKEL